MTKFGSMESETLYQDILALQVPAVQTCPYVNYHDGLRFQQTAPVAYYKDIEVFINITKALNDLPELDAASFARNMIEHEIGESVVISIRAPEASSYAEGESEPDASSTPEDEAEPEDSSNGEGASETEGASGVEGRSEAGDGDDSELAAADQPELEAGAVWFKFNNTKA
jgi:hypothetical protein